MSQTLVVGTCKPHQKSYTTIGAAVKAAQSGSTIQVCPGTYTEQVVITIPLTLKGISAPPLGNPTIVAPADFTTTLSTGPASMIAVDTGGAKGSVDIQGLAIDATNACPSGHGEVSGILYISSNGTISNTVIQNIPYACEGAGIWAENDGSRTMTLTAQNNVIQNFPDGYGIGAFSGPSSGSLNFQVQGNVISDALYGTVFSTNGRGVCASANAISGFTGYAMYVSDASTIDRNVITGGAFGVWINGNGSTVTNNTLNDAGQGGIYIEANDTTTVASNRILGDRDFTTPSGRGIVDLSPSAIIQSNTIGYLGYGIELPCNATSVNGNSIFNSIVGINGVPANASLTNNFFNVATPQAACP